MPPRRRLSRTAAALVTGVLAGLGSPAQAAQVEVGRPLPVTRFPDARDGSLRDLAEFRGKPLLLHVYASW